MITVRINGSQRNGVDEGWINHTIRALRGEGETVCVRVSVASSHLNVGLTAGVCMSGPGGDRPPNAGEAAVLEAWESCGLKGEVDFPVGRLIQCIKRVEIMSS